MKAQSRAITLLSERIARVHARERREHGPKRVALLLWRWLLMLYHEFLRDDVQIRAGSLSYFMIFSMLPLIAGGFFLFSIFAQFGMVQDTIAGVVQHFLSTIPEEHRGFVEEYVLHFKDVYLANLASKSGSIGIFALFILAWVGLQMFNNIDSTLNTIWGAERERPFLEKVRNFLVVSVAAPLVLLSALSLPHVLVKMEMSRGIVERVPFLLRFFNTVIVPALVLGTFGLLYRFVPVRRVYWRSALGGALFAAVGLELSNVLMGYYFRFGTNSAYGKAAVIPLFGFWIYIVWIIVIMGAEVSYLLQNERDVLSAGDEDPTLREGQALVLALREMLVAHRAGEIPVSFDRLLSTSGLGSIRARAVVAFLTRDNLIVPCAATGGNAEGCFALGRDVASVSVADTLRAFVGNGWHIDGSPVDRTFLEAYEHWLGSFGSLRVGDLLPPPSDAPPRSKKR